MGANQTKITYFDGSQYHGEVNETKKQHGKGRITYANGDVLQGTFLNGDCNYAFLKKKNGDSYEGQMKQGKYHGKGILKTKVSKQVGLFRNSRFLDGTITFVDGSIYVGSIENGSKVGKGKLTTADGHVYDGFFKNDKFEGTGYILYKDGTSYSGQFKLGQFHGKGRLVKMQNNKKVMQYEGQFARGQFQGQGELKLLLLNQTYFGHFLNGHKHGRGTYIYGNGSKYQGLWNYDLKTDPKCKITMHNGGSYRGGIVEGVYQGWGQLVRSNGDKYQGEFKKGLKHGRGKLVLADAIYQGGFVDDKKQGLGKIFQGSFLNDKKHGKGVLKSKTQYFEAEYCEGQKHGHYRKKIGNDYQQEGTYDHDRLHGQIKIKKGEFKAIYQYENGVKIRDID